MKNKLFTLALIVLLSSCMPDGVKQRLDEGMKQGETMLADMEFKKAIANIELHKLRYASYPDSLSELKFLSAMDSSIFSNVTYARLDSGYELNVKIDFPSLTGDGQHKVVLQYPSEFWKGLGCVKSNFKDNDEH